MILLELPYLSPQAQASLKWVALAAMLLDHLNAVVLGFGYPWMLWLGRLAFPLFAFGVAYNLEVRKVPFARYWPRLLIFGLISQPIYGWATGNPVLNIFFTLLASSGLWAASRALQARGWDVYKRLVLLLPALLAAAFVDFSLMGVLMVPVWAAVLRYPGVTRWAVWSMVSLGLNYFLPPSVMVLLVLPLILWVGSRPMPLALPLIPSGSIQRWFFYGFYPAHLLLLGSMRHFGGL